MIISFLYAFVPFSLFTHEINFKMESDREASNLGLTISVEPSVEEGEKPRLPRKRFIGRRTAAERASKHGDLISPIEESKELQGRYTCLM